MSKNTQPFFVGYLGIPKALKGFLLKVSLLMIAGFAVGAVLAGATQDDPGKAGFRFDYGRQTLTGILQARPYPLLYVTEGNERIGEGRTLMLSGQGKTPIMADLAALDGSEVKISGVLLQRGELNMLQVAGGNRGIEKLAEGARIPQSTPIGRWKVKGEICDGKCLAGAMNPGRGLAHKACANLCLLGDIPPVFVSSQPIEGEEFLLVAGKDGGPFSRDLYHHVGQFVELETEIERRGDLLVMKIDPETIRAVE